MPGEKWSAAAIMSIGEGGPLRWSEGSFESYCSKKKNRTILQKSALGRRGSWGQEFEEGPCPFDDHKHLGSATPFPILCTEEERRDPRDNRSGHHGTAEDCRHKSRSRKRGGRRGKTDYPRYIDCPLLASEGERRNPAASLFLDAMTEQRKLIRLAVTATRKKRDQKGTIGSLGGLRVR